jgi:excisionase family DNA binding protein
MTDHSEWISLGEAAKLLGVHPTTVRNWADQGDLPFRRTPGRHRRFNRALLETWASEHKVSDKPAVPVSPHNPQVLAEYALGHTRFSVGESDLHQKSWYEKLSPQGIENSRQFGRRLLECLVRHLEDQYAEGEELQVARQLGMDYAHMLQQEGLTLVQVVQGFVYFDDFLIEAVVQMMAPNMTTSPSEWSDLLRQINAFTNELLVAMVEYYQTP